MKPLGVTGFLPHSDTHGQLIYKAIREGLVPFKARTINLYFEYDIDYNRYVIFAEVWFRDLQLRGRADIDAFDMADNTDREVYKAAEKMFEAFRYREERPVPENIILGEE